MSRCPAPEQLDRLLDEQLSDYERRHVSAHVSECPACQEALERLTGAAVSCGSSAAVSDATPNEPLAPFLARLQESSIIELMGSTPVTPADVLPERNGTSAADAARIPGYEIIGELGRGGMGVVHKARQLGLNRLVALKMILAGPNARPADLARFRREAEAVARLHHANIVQIHDIGEANGVAYFALELVEHGSLAQRLRGDPQPIASTVKLVETLAGAIHFAHQRGVVHRDLKPANILLAAAGADEEPAPAPAAEPLATAVPKISDFGLAKRLDEQTASLQTSEIVGTPSYMAPEQASGRTHQIGPATDVYALGAVLYEMLTGRPPFKGATTLDTVLQVLHEEPVRPSGLRPNLPRDLEIICLKCLNKEPWRRYASAAALADDLQRFRKGKPILARPTGVLERGWKWAQRAPLTAALLAGMIVSVILGFAGIGWQWREAAQARDAAVEEQIAKESQRQQAEQARASAIEERSRAQTALYYSRIAQGQLEWRVNNVAEALRSLARCVPRPDREDQRGWEWHYLQGLFHSDLLTLHHTYVGQGGSAVFHPGGRTIVSVIGGYPTDDDAHPGEIRVWDAVTGAQQQSYRVPSTAHRLAFRPDGERFALGTADGQVLILDAAGKELSRTTPHQQLVSAVSFSPNGRLLASASWDQTVKITDAATGDVLRILRVDAGRVQAVAFHPDGKQLATGDWDSTVRIWDRQTGKETLTLRGHKSPVYGVAFSPDGTLLASAASNGNLRIWELATGRVIQSLTGRSGAVLSNCFSPDGRYLAYAGGDGTVRVWDVESGEEKVVFRGHSASVDSVQFSPDGRRLVSASPLDAVVMVWDFTRHPEYATLARVRGRADEQIKVRDLTNRPDAAKLARTGPDLEALAFHRDGTQLVSVAVGGALQTWDAASGALKEQRSLPISDELVSPAALARFGPGAERLAGRAREDKTLVKVWDTASGKELVAFRGHTLPVLVVQFSMDGRRLATCACAAERAERPHEIKVWDAATGACLASLTGKGLLFQAAFSPDNRLLALGGQDGVVRLTEWASARPPVRLRGHKSHVAAVAFRGDGRMLASAGVEDKVVKIWELDGFDPSAETPPKGHTVAAPLFLCDLAFSPDGRRLAGVSRDVVKMWDVSTRQEVLTLRGAPKRHWDPAFNPRVAFSPDGARLAGTNWDESISLWDAGSVSQADRRQALDARAASWHLEEAEDCLEHGNFPAMRFHLQQIGSAPLPGPLQSRKDRLTQEAGK